MAPLIALNLGPDRQRELVSSLARDFHACVKARYNQVDSKYTRWTDNYSGKPLEAIRTTPFYRASNFVPQLIRMHTDILSARIYGLILATKPMWRPQALMSMPHEDVESLTEWMEFVSRFQVRLPEVLDTSIFRAFKTGQLILKGPWVEDRRWKVTGLSEDGKSTKKEEIVTPHLDLRPIAFDDVWVNPITVQWLRDARQIFHRIRLSKPEVEWRAANNVWAAAGTTKLLSHVEQAAGGTARDTQATEAGIALTPDVTRPYSVIEAWCDYELEPGRTYEIVVVFNPFVDASDGYLRGYYNPYTRLRNCFGELKFLPREDFIYGYSIPEILEQSQEEQAQIHNARRDSNTIGNIPTFKKKRYADVPNPSSEWYPGKTFELESMDDMDVLNLQVNYNSMIDEEKFILQLAEAYTGVQPPLQGFGAGVLSGKRGIYNTGATLAMLAEGNKRLDIYLARARYPMHDVGNLIYQTYRQFRPSGSEYASWGVKGESIQRTFRATEPRDFPGFFFNIAAADATANREIDKTSLLLMANTMAGYYRQVVEAASSFAQLPQGHPLQNILLTVLDGAKDLADRLLFAFDIGDRKRLLPDVRELLGGSPNAGAESAQRAGVPGSDEVVSIDRLRDLSQAVAAIPGRNQQAPGGGRGPSGAV